MCAMVIHGPPMSTINIWKSSIRPVDGVEVPDLTNDNSRIIVQDKPISLSLACLEDKQNLLELTNHLFNTQEILKEECFHGKHVLESNKALDYDGIRADMKFNISKSYNLLSKAIDSLKTNLLDLELPEIRMPTSAIDATEWSITSSEDASYAPSSILVGVAESNNFL